MHISDLIMYFICLAIIWKLLELISNGEFTEELGGAVIGVPVITIYTIVYIILFCFYPDWNWVDIFKSVTIPNIKFYFQW